MVRGDGWFDPGEGMLTMTKKKFDVYTRHANAASRVFRRIEKRENNIRPSELN
jgi:hypothetical protein